MSLRVHAAKIKNVICHDIFEIKKEKMSLPYSLDVVRKDTLGCKPDAGIPAT